jgi:glycosyltransferase involved in cell wall biosynthesis
MRLITEAEADRAQRPEGARLPKVAVVIPAYNEEHNIESVLREIQKLQAAHPKWEILPIVVNDGSTDQTEHVLNQISEKYGARVIHLPVNLGIGRAVQSGIRFAVQWGADAALQLDGDGQHPADQIPAIIEPILTQTADVVVGSRYVKGAGGNVSNHFRQAGTMFFSALLKILTGVRVYDTTSGFRAFNRDSADFIARYYPDDYPEVEAYVPLARKKFSIIEVPVSMRPRAGGHSSITPVLSVYYMIKVAFATIIDAVRPLPPRRHFDSPEENPRDER